MKDEIINRVKRYKRNILTDSREKGLSNLDTSSWSSSKYFDYGSIFSNYTIPMFIGDDDINQIRIKQKEGNGKKNVYVSYNGNGVLAESTQKDIVITSIQEGIDLYPMIVKEHIAKRREKKLSKDALLALYGFKSGYFVYIPENVCPELTDIFLYSSLDKPELVELSYNLIIIGKGNNVRLVEEKIPVAFEGESTRVLYTEIFAHENATCRYIHLGTESSQIYQLETKDIYLDMDSSVSYTDILLGGKTTSQNISSYLVGDRSVFSLHGIAVSGGEQVCETKTLINNIGKGTSGRILYKNIVDGKSKLRFDGLIKVEKTGMFTDSYLEDHTILLSKEAFTDSVPGLEIEANEVKASHGATVGKMDDSLLFYIKSRGLPEVEAKKLILSGFIRPVLDELNDNASEDRILTYFRNKMKHEPRLG